MLSHEEIHNLCRMALKRYIIVVEVLELLCDYFTQLIFIAVDIDMADEIPLTRIKEAILNVNDFKEKIFLMKK